MNIEVLLVQFLVLAFTGVLWWIARRDLAARSVPPSPVPPAETADLEQLCATLETLVTRLSRRLDFVERQLATGVDQDAPPVTPQAVLPEQPTRIPEMARMNDPARMQEELARLADGIARMEEGLAHRQSERQEEPAALSVSPIPSLSAPSPQETIQETRQEAEPARDPRYGLVYAMLDEGVTDPVEIARRTGLGRGEVDLIVNLRERRAF